MAGRMVIQRTLFLDKEDYKTFKNFTFLIDNLASNLADAEIDDLQEAIEQFVEKVNVEMEEEDF